MIGSRLRFQALPKASGFAQAFRLGRPAFEDTRAPHALGQSRARTLGRLPNATKASRQSSEDCSPDESMPWSPRTRFRATRARPVVLGRHLRTSGRLHPSSRGLIPVSRPRICATCASRRASAHQVTGLGDQNADGDGTCFLPSPRTRHKTLPPARMTSSSLPFTLARALVLPLRCVTGRVFREASQQAHRTDAA